MILNMKGIVQRPLSAVFESPRGEGWGGDTYLQGDCKKGLALLKKEMVTETGNTQKMLLTCFGQKVSLVQDIICCRLLSHVGYHLM